MSGPFRALRRMVGAVLALGACGGQREVPSDAAAVVVPAVPAPTASAVIAPPAPSSAANLAPRDLDSSSTLRPPTVAGESITSIQGCLTSINDNDNGEDGRRFPVTRASGPAVTVHTTGTGVVVTHQLAHACCLRGAFEVSVERSLVRVTETLSGQPCRCQCRSSLKTAVGLTPGTYQLEVRVVEPDGAVRQVHGDSLEVKRLRAQ